MQHTRVCLRWSVVLIAGLVVSASLPAHAEILDMHANITAEVREFVDGEPLFLDSAFEDFPGTAAELPIHVAASLGDEETPDKQAVAFADFRDPARIPDSPNPQEFGLEAICVSLDPTVRYTVSATAVEVRKVRLGRHELYDPPVEPVTVMSRVFLSGAMVAWSEDGARDLTGLKAELVVRVLQLPPKDSQETSEQDWHLDEQFDEEKGREVFSTKLVLLGQPDGTVFVEREGPIHFVLDGEERLSGSPAALDDGAFGDLVDTTIDQLGRVHVLLIPDQVLPYFYLVAPGSKFDLEARIETRVANLPGGTGVASAFGRPFGALDAMLDASTAQDGGMMLQAAVNAAQAALEPITVDVSTPAGIGNAAFGWAPCGGFGIEVLALMMLVPGIRLLPSRPAILTGLKAR